MALALCYDSRGRSTDRARDCGQPLFGPAPVPDTLVTSVRVLCEPSARPDGGTGNDALSLLSMSHITQRTRAGPSPPLGTTKQMVAGAIRMGWRTTGSPMSEAGTPQTRPDPAPDSRDPSVRIGPASL